MGGLNRGWWGERGGGGAEELFPRCESSTGEQIVRCQRGSKGAGGKGKKGNTPGS